jgi:ribosomal protein L16 Arg81 hydroxylase
MDAFEKLIAPIEPQTFFARHWERAPLHIHRGDAGFYRDVLAKSDLEQMISSGVLRHPALQLSKAGRFYPAESFSRNIRTGADTFSGVLNVGKVVAEYRGGATVLLPGLQRSHAPIRALTTALEDFFNHPVQANAYLTPENAIGFAPHYDTHDVFVLQIAGAKHWCIHEPLLALPYRSQPFTNESGVPAKMLMTVNMEAGDLLYLPRGFIHSTSTSQSSSVHLTIGMTVMTWLDLAGDLVQASREDVRLRKSLPVGFASRPEAIAEMREAMRAIFEGLASSERMAALIENFAQRVKATQGAPEEDFRIDSTS